jgi:hypothetical protein
MDRDPIQIHENANERTSIAKLSGLGQTPDLDVTCIILASHVPQVHQLIWEVDAGTGSTRYRV